MRTPKSNSKFIKKYYKESTIPRLSYLGYNTLKSIDECPVITEWLDICFYYGTIGYVQDELFMYVDDKKNFSVVGLEDSIIEWYKTNFGDDEVSNQINQTITFADVYKTLLDCNDVYDCIGVRNPMVRYRIFESLAKRIFVKYDYINILWIEKSRKILKKIWQFENNNIPLSY